MRAIDLLAPMVPACNPAYPASDAEVEERLLRMADTPVGLPRPLLILAGWRSPSLPVRLFARRLVRYTGADPAMIATVSYPGCGRIRSCARRAVLAATSRFGTGLPGRTPELDVVGVSMGGLVAWAGAEWGDGERRLAIARLFTLATPWRGARLARRVRPDRASAEMRPGSAFMREVHASHESLPYPIVPYAVLRDGWVGASRSAPPGMDPIWVPGRFWLGHNLVTADRRILADLACRLRGERPLGSPSPPRNPVRSGHEGEAETERKHART